MTAETLSHGENEYRAMTSSDLDQIVSEIGDRFGHSSIHAMAFDGLRQHLKDAIDAHTGCGCNGRCRICREKGFT